MMNDLYLVSCLFSEKDWELSEILKDSDSSTGLGDLSNSNENAEISLQNLSLCCCAETH